MKEPITYEHEQRLVAKRWEFRNRFKRESHYTMYKLTIVYVFSFGVFGYVGIVPFSIYATLLFLYGVIVWLALKFIRE